MLSNYFISDYYAILSHKISYTISFTIRFIRFLCINSLEVSLSLKVIFIIYSLILSALHGSIYLLPLFLFIISIQYIPLLLQLLFIYQSYRQVYQQVQSFASTLYLWYFILLLFYTLGHDINFTFYTIK